MKTVLSLFLVVLLAAGSFAATPVLHGVRYGGHGNPLDTQWGPDPFGYRAKDSNEAGGPTYRWFPIDSTGGTQVNGLGDDNVVGPYNIGWSFRYYWYDVTHFWIGSNGYIEFLSNAQHAANFLQFPTSTYQDVLGVWMGDWIFGQTTGRPASPSLCYYWTNNVDTLIVMYKNTAAWAATSAPNPDWVGNHNFEVILSGTDSSFTFMYGQSTTGDIDANENQSRGFDNITGALGLSFAFGTTYPANNYAIKTDYPDVITYAVHDLGIAGVQNSRSPGFFMLVGNALAPWFSIRNTGNQNENSYFARYSIRNAVNYTLLATDTVTMGAIAASEVDTITFPPLWTPAAAGVFKAVGRVTLTGDNYTPNDSNYAEIHTLTLPGELYYDDGQSEQAWQWNGGNGGMANEFVPPVYPVEITQVRFWIEVSGPFMAVILDDGGVGFPTNTLWSQNVPNPPGATWASVEVNPPVVIESGAFYVAWQTTVQTASFGTDTVSTLGFARRAWEYTGVWAPFREAATSDPLIRATIDFAGNHAPVITSHTPASLDTAIQNQQYTFSITATDADNDPLQYAWRLNGTVVGTAPSVNVTYTQLGANHLVASVFDGADYDSVSWNTWVRLGSAASDPALLPTEFALHTAYPNPFNPVTSIAYDVARDAQVTLRVFNLAGEVVSTLVDSRMEPGRYHAEWNAAAQPSGTYFVAFDASGVHQVQKILLLK